MTGSRNGRTVLKDSNTLLLQDLTPELHPFLKTVTGPKADYLRTSLFSKFVSKDTDPAEVRKQRAIEKWLAVEVQNTQTNERLLTIDGEYNILPRVTYASFMQRVRSIVKDVIGEVPPIEVIFGSFSGGATTSRRRTKGHPSLKYLGEAHITQEALPWWEVVFNGSSSWWSEDFSERPFGWEASATHPVKAHYPQRGWESARAGSPLWASANRGKTPMVVPGNVLFTVPKTTEIDRCSCKEPDLNMYMQKGVGDYIRKRLRKFGIDLNDQSRNRALAKEGSITGALATIDLSSASDTVTAGLVEECLPLLWFTLLDDLRCTKTLVNGSWHDNEMFSSMGNGFTFELESLLFYAVARATAWSLSVPGIVSVYGDDIIVPSEIARELIYALKVLGFTANSDKSFYEGPFRESCGGHFISGLDVTPFYVRKPVTHLIDLIHVCNSMRKWAVMDGGCGVLDPEVYPFWKSLADQVPDVFWGGHDYADKTRLVAPPKGRVQRRLSARKKVLETGLGGYLHWHDSSSKRLTPADDEMGPSSATSYAVRHKEIGTYRVRPVRRQEQLTDYFYEEVMCQEASIIG